MKIQLTTKTSLTRTTQEKRRLEKNTCKVKRGGEHVNAVGLIEYPLLVHNTLRSYLLLFTYSLTLFFTSQVWVFWTFHHHLTHSPEEKSIFLAFYPQDKRTAILHIFCFSFLFSSRHSSQTYLFLLNSLYSKLLLTLNPYLLHLYPNYSSYS